MNLKDFTFKYPEMKLQFELQCLAPTGISSCPWTETMT